jgi:hypothetical protein
MTRTADRTLLQSLGFSDPDKGNEEHDLACRFMIEPRTIAKLVELLDPKPFLGGFRDRTWSDQQTRYVDRIVEPDHRGAVERPLVRDSGYYVGFIDAAIDLEWCCSARPEVRKRSHHQENWGDWESCKQFALTVSTHRSNDDEDVYENGRRIVRPYKPAWIGVEVKIGPTKLGDAIKQIKLYQEYGKADRWVLATRYGISTAERDALAHEGIFHIRLAAGFDRFLEEQRASEPSEGPEL